MFPGRMNQPMIEALDDEPLFHSVVYACEDIILQSLGMAIRVRVPDPMGPGTGTIFYPWVAPVPDPNRDRYGMDIFFHPQVTRRVSDTLLPL
jgi:hypothetical protein